MVTEETQEGRAELILGSGWGEQSSASAEVPAAVTSYRGKSQNEDRIWAAVPQFYNNAINIWSVIVLWYLDVAGH